MQTTPPARPHRQLSNALGALHRVLLNAEAQEAGLAGNPYRLLGAVMHDPRFAWLRPVSQLMAALDELGAKGAVPEPAALAPHLETAEQLLDPIVPEPEGFRARLDAWRARDPAVAEPEAALRQVLRDVRAQVGPPPLH